MLSRPFRRVFGSLVIMAIGAAMGVTGAPPASAARDRTPPTTPGNLRLVSIDQTSATVTWSPSSDNRGVTSYSVWAEGTGNGVVSVPHPGTTATVSDLSPGQPYVLKVRAFDAAYNGSADASLPVTTPADTTAPTTPSGLQVLGVQGSQVELRWTSSTDSVSQVRYEVLVNGVPTANARSTIPAGTFPRPSVSGAVVRQLAPGTTYEFTVWARDATGNVSGSSNTVAATTEPSSDTVAPTTPTLTSANDGGDGSCPAELWLRWIGSTDDSGFVEYEIRSNGVILEIATGTAFITYTEFVGMNRVTIVAVDAAGNASAPSNAIEVNVRYNPCPI